MAGPLLSIALPMFRDDHACRRAFHSALLPVTERSDIELIICDNNPDADRSFIHSSLNSRINYIPNESNIGGSENFKKVYTKSSGAFVLMLGDDDYLDPTFLDTYVYLLNHGYFDRSSVIASAPLFFDTPGILCHNPRVPANTKDLLSPSASKRIRFYSEWLNNTPGNPLYYSIMRKTEVDFTFHIQYSLGCPGYTSFIDVPFAEGLAMVHPVEVLPRSFYTYNMQNWGPTSWQSREIEKYKHFLKKDINENSSDKQIFAIRYLNKCIIALSYFLGLGLRYSFHSKTFDMAEYLMAVRNCMKYRYLPKGVDGVDLMSLSPTHDALLSLLQRLLDSISPYLRDNKIFQEFVLRTSSVVTDNNVTNQGQDHELE